MRLFVLKCPATHRDFTTGIEIEEDSFKRVRDTITKAICPHCGKKHIWWTSEGHLELDDRTSSDELIKAFDRADPRPVALPSPFPSPWTVTELVESFVVRDANDQSLSYVYFDDDPQRPSAIKRPTRGEAGEIAATIAKLPELLGRDQAHRLAANWLTNDLAKEGSEGS